MGASHKINNKQNTWRKEADVLVNQKKSKLSIMNKLNIYKTIIKPIWTYGVPLWGTAAMSHINKIETEQAKILKTIVNAPWYVRNEDLHKNLKIPTVKEEIATYAKKYKKRLVTRPNQLVAETNKTIIERRLKKKHPADLTIEIQ